MLAGRRGAAELPAGNSGAELVLAGRPRVSRQEGNWPGSGTRVF